MSTVLAKVLLFIKGRRYFKKTPRSYITPPKKKIIIICNNAPTNIRYHSCTYSQSNVPYFIGAKRHETSFV